MTSITYTTPWPEGRPPHMLLVNQIVYQEAIDNMIEHHLVSCEECQVWAAENDHDPENWLYPRDD
jgi:hypothetical protein